MCGIIGYVGKSNATGILLKGLKSLEYRGYDSAGIAVFNDSAQSDVKKCKGRVEALCEIAKNLNSNAGIGHTRWATHGMVNDANSHPHKFNRVTVVHNGIIENYESIRDTLGVSNELKSQTDSEVVAALIDSCYNGDEKQAIISAAKRLTGTYALAVMFDGNPNSIYAVRNVSPIVCCKNDDGAYIASDIMAIGEYSSEYFVLPEFSVAQINENGFEIESFAGEEIIPKNLKLDWDIRSAGKCGYPFYMEKEIAEQPSVIRKTIEKRIVNGIPEFTVDGVDDGVLANCSRIIVVACGTAMHAGLVGKSLIEKICEIQVDVCMASEFIYGTPIINDDTLVICVSQSGETVDTLEALKLAKSKGASTLSIVNVIGSSIARESDYVVYTSAGPEIAVASTKAYSAQCTVFYLITARLALIKGTLNVEGVKSFVRELCEIPDKVQAVIDRREEIHRLSSSLLLADNVFMIGRGIDYPVLLEASLKLKEISYIHSEAFASGELKHGTIALITEKTPVISLLTQKNVASKQASNVNEVRSRGANVISIARKSLCSGKINCEFSLPESADEFSVLPAVTALQLVAYYVSSDKGLDVDKPRNLAKVVTVE